MSIHKDQAIKAEEQHLPKELFNDGQMLSPEAEHLSFEDYNRKAYKVLRNLRNLYQIPNLYPHQEA